MTVHWLVAARIAHAGPSNWNRPDPCPSQMTL